ncbi:MAG: hypothetical protein HYY84_15950 [Deltaproteobacteria bacterium]|nr:hypothetical protein [Deltaproteobacteria bacterium]
MVFRTVLTAGALCCGLTTSCSRAPDPGAASDAGTTTDSWAQVVGNGFVSAALNTVPEMEVYNGYLYVAVAPTDAGLAKLYRSSSGDVGSWIEVTPPLAGDKSIHSFGKTSLDGGYLWCGTGGASGGMIFRTQDGANWTAIANRGFGNALLKNAAPHMVLFQGTGDASPYLYAAMNSHGGGTAAQVWRIPFADSNPNNWVKVHDFSGSNPVIDQVTYFFLWSNTLYFGTNAGAQLWQSTDGTTFTKNTAVGNGFGESTNAVIASMEEFNGAFYATTNNPTKGGQIWRMSDGGTTWQKITGDAFGKGAAVFELRSIRASFGKLWTTGYTDTALSGGTPIWRSDDGVTWVQSNVDGFGDTNNNGQNAVVIGFGDYEYFGGPNYVAGGQVWRTKMQ